MFRETISILSACMLNSYRYWVEWDRNYIPKSSWILYKRTGPLNCSFFRPHASEKYLEITILTHKSLKEPFFPRGFRGRIIASQFQVRKKQPKYKVFGRDIPGTSGTLTSGYPRQKTLCKWPFSVVLDTEWPGCPGIWVGTSRIWKNFMQENFGLIFRALQFQ